MTDPTTTLAPRRPCLASDLPRLPIVRLLGVGLVGIAAIVILVLVRLTGGTPSPLNHLGYLPVIVAAYVFGLRGGLAAAAWIGLVLGPAAELGGLGGGHESWDVSAFRTTMLFLVGGAAGWLFDRLRATLRQLRTTATIAAKRQRDGVLALARGAEAKDAGTGEHVVRVQRVSEELARATGMDPDQAAAVGWSAMLHDIGKLHVPDRILLKAGPLTKDEWEVMQMHPIWGAEILAQGDGFETARHIARWHHENVDGSGYPDRLRGDQIPLEARIVRVADAFDAMTHDRPYQEARSLAWAMDELEREAGHQFDPELVRLLIASLEADPELGRRLERIDRPAALVGVGPRWAPSARPLGHLAGVSSIR